MAAMHEIKITINTSDLERKLRIIAAKLSELADDLAAEPVPEAAPERADEPEPPKPACTEINNTTASTERRWAPHITAPATPFGFGR